MFLMGHYFDPRGDHHLAFAPIRHPPQRSSNRDKGKPTSKRSVSLLTPHCPSDHIQAVVQCPLLSLMKSYAIASVAPPVTD